MGLLPCPDCGNKVSDAAPVCPKCGRPITEADRATYDQASRAVGYGCLVVALLLLGTCAYIDWRSSDPAAVAERQAQDRLITTYYNCQEKVTERLRSPSTAKFPMFSSADVKARQHNDSTYVVLAWVDAQNAFGATVRNTFLCEITYGAKGWRLSSLNMSGG